MDIYSYVGPKHIINSVSYNIQKFRVTNSENVKQWIQKTSQVMERDYSIIATYIIDEQQQLWITDRRYEHVACAEGKRVLAAGEMTFLVENNVSISEISNQSTGYCPKKSCWQVVETVMRRTGMNFPNYWTLAVTFRMCKNCHQRNIVKDAFFICDVCGEALNLHWNF